MPAPVGRLEASYGFDPATLVRLAAEDRRQTAILARLGLLPCLLVAAGAAYACHLVLLNLAADLATALGAGLFVWNLQRLSVAGAGIAPHWTPEEAATWRPSPVPMLLFAYLGFLAGQPLYLGLDAGRLDAQIEAYRTQLVATHRNNLREGPLEPLFIRSYQASRQAQALGLHLGVLSGQRARTLLARNLAAGDRGPGAAARNQRLADELAALDEAMARTGTAARSAAEVAEATGTEAAQREEVEIAAFRANLEASGFLAQRLKLAWHHPFLPLLTGVLTALASALPLLYRWRKALGYERERHGTTRTRIERAGLAAEAEISRQLERYPTHKPDHGVKYLDPPFNMRPAMAAPIAAEALSGEDLLALLPEGGNGG